MKLLKRNSDEPDVLILQKLLCKWGFTVELSGFFNQKTEEAVCLFQRSQNLSPDGIVGNQTWNRLNDDGALELKAYKLSDSDFINAAGQLHVEVAVVKAVQEVETGGKGGFFKPGYPAILFEGHIFWSQLKKQNIHPEDVITNNEDILYPKWTKHHYKGGLKEYDRLEQAKKINITAAYSSASWGMFQIMGFNYAACGCQDVVEFVEQMSQSEGKQLELFVRFLQTNKWSQYLQSLNWTEFARHYNGPGYAQNHYDEKLAAAYRKYAIQKD